MWALEGRGPKGEEAPTEKRARVSICHIQKAPKVLIGFLILRPQVYGRAAALAALRPCKRIKLHVSKTGGSGGTWSKRLARTRAGVRGGMRVGRCSK